jgi:hypothetical protein
MTNLSPARLEGGPSIQPAGGMDAPAGVKWRRRESKFYTIPRVKRLSSIKAAQKTAHFRWTLRIWHSS